MTCNHRLCFACLSFALLLLIAPAARAIPIDSFAALSPAVVNTTSPGAGDTIDGPRTDPSILGARTLTNEGNALDPGDSITLGDGAFSAVSGTSTFPMILSYDFTAEPGGSVDFSPDPGLFFTYALIDSDGQTFMDTIISIDTATGMLDLIGAHFPDLPAGIRTDLVPFASFSGSGDLAQVTALSIRFNDPLTRPGLDFTLTNLATTPIPEPSALASALLGVLALFATRRSPRG